MNKYYSLPLPCIDSAISYIDGFFNSQIIRGLSDTTLDMYKKEAILFFSIFSPKNVKLEYIERYIIDYGDVSISQKNARNSSLRAILRYLLSIGFENCDLKIYFIKDGDKLPKFIEEDEINSLIKKIKINKFKSKGIWRGRRDYAILLFMYATGLRVSELVNFSILDLEGSFVRVNNGKGDKDRMVPIAKVAIKALEDYLKYIPHHIKSSYKNVFISDLLVPFSTKTFYHYCMKTFGYNPHIFRHTFATHLILNGCSEILLMDFMGHSSLSTTQIYTHIKKNKLKFTVENCFPKL